MPSVPLCPSIPSPCPRRGLGRDPRRIVTIHSKSLWPSEIRNTLSAARDARGDLSWTRRGVSPPNLCFIALRKMLPAIGLRQLLHQREVVAMYDLVGGLVGEHAGEVVVVPPP